MKTSSKFLLAASLLAAGIAGAQAAPVTYHITGSSAFRGAVTNSLIRLLDPSVAQPTGAFANLTASGALSSSAASSFAGANNQIIHGFLLNAAGSLPKGQEVYFETSWSGSLSGIIALTTSSNTAVPFLTPANTESAVNATSSGATQGYDIAGNNATPQTTTSPADIALSDVFQASTAYKSPTLAAPSVTTVTSPQPGIIGVVPFNWVAGAADSANAITNINSIQIQQLLVGGLALSQLTGAGPTSNDASTLVLPVGRDADSGTRFTAFAESGFSIIGIRNTSPQQYSVQTQGGVTDLYLYPAETLFGTPYAAGTQGYASGSGVAGDLANPNTLSYPNNPAILVGYVSEGDAKTAVGSGKAPTGAHFIPYNGVPYGSLTVTNNVVTVSYNRALLDNGKYTFWGYEHLYLPSGTSSTSSLGVIGQQLANSVAGTDALISGESLANMNVSRPQEGAPISFGN